MVKEILAFLVRSGWSPPEVALVRHDLPRWERHLRSRGITVVPGPGYWSDEEDRAHSELFMLMMQSRHSVDSKTEHKQRDITEVRPPNPGRTS
jgi:hypothetical protein